MPAMTMQGRYFWNTADLYNFPALFEYSFDCALSAADICAISAWQPHAELLPRLAGTSMQ